MIERYAWSSLADGDDATNDLPKRASRQGAALMRRVYSAATLPDAHLIVGLLGQAGIPARVFNENAQGGVGEIPFVHAWPEVWVEDERDGERALEIIRSFDKDKGSDRQVACPGCGEPNPENFEVCWNCGVTLAG